MTTPLPRTPGDQREDHAAAAGAAVAAIYQQAELVIIAAIAALARKLAAGSMTQAVAVRQLRRTVTTVLSDAAPRIRQELDDAMSGASQQARTMVTSTSPFPGAGPDIGQWSRPLAELLDQAGDTAAQTTEDEFASVATAIADVGKTPLPGGPPILPPNPYQAAIGRVLGEQGWPGSTLSARRIEAAQEILDDLAEHGITGFTDKAGRKWDLATYVEMATRTAVSNAWDDMQAAAAVRSGFDLVLVGTHSTEGTCPACLPWLGKTLSLTGATEGYPTLAEAKEAGFRHPNCRCFWVTIGSGMAADVTNPVDLEDAAEIYKASQHQRALERRVRAAGRHAQTAITPQAKTRARRELAAARAASAAHRKQHQLRMMKVTVQRRERPFGAR